MSGHIEYLYVHFPFCKSKCPYCDFFSIPNADQKMKDLYTLSLIKELEARSEYMARPLRSVYLGGGSPIVIGSDNLNSLFKRLEAFISKGTEATIELNPEHLEEEQYLLNMITLFKKIGINRISLGIQTVDTKLREHISRHFNMDKLKNTLGLLKNSGFIISFDFMFGLPYQTLDLLKKDISFIKQYRPHHVSMYLFTPPVGFSLTNKQPADDVIEEMFLISHEELERIGYSHYEISNYALPSYESKHNSAYWRRDPYIGIGAAAHSFYKANKIRTWHEKDIKAYIKEPNSVNSEIIDQSMENIEAIMLGLRMLKEGVHKSTFKDDRFKEFVDLGLLVPKGDNLLAHYKAVPIIDAIIKALV